MPDTYRVRVNFGITVEGGTEVERREFVEEYITDLITNGDANHGDVYANEIDATGGGPVSLGGGRKDLGFRVKSIVKPRNVNQ